MPDLWTLYNQSRKGLAEEGKPQIPTFSEYLRDKPWGQTYYPPGTPDPYMERYKREYQELYGVNPMVPTIPLSQFPELQPEIQMPAMPPPPAKQLPTAQQPDPARTWPQPTREQTIRQTYQPYQGYQEQQTPQGLSAYLQPQPYQPSSYQQPYQQPSLRQSLQPYQPPSYQQPFDWSQMAEQWKPRINRSPLYQ